MLELKGIPASPGLAVGKAFIYRNNAPDIPRYQIGSEDIEAERRRLREAFVVAENELRELRDRAAREMGGEQAKIFDAHLLMLGDADLLAQIDERLLASKLNIEWVIWDLTQELTQRLMQAPDPNLRERSLDIHDVFQRLLNRLLRLNQVSFLNLPQDVVLVAYNLLPSEALVLDKQRVKALVLEGGAKTSHTAILARAFEIPAVLGLPDAVKTIMADTVVLVDGGSGKVAVNPDKASLARFHKLFECQKGCRKALLADRSLPAMTKDGHRVSLLANIEFPEEVAQALDYGAEGIGLYRSEFLFLAPGRIAGEDEQYEAYKRVVTAMAGRPVTIRSLDIGGDKLIPILQSTREKNPLLGWRAIRFCLSQPELFRTQLKALLRAGSAGDLRIMFPMISGLEELEVVLELLEEAKKECAASGLPYKADLPVGIMIEIPSAAMTADILAKRAAFFSIGTNDLIQYSLAADRDNERVAYLAQPFHPALIRLIQRIIEAAHQQGIPAALCGELAGETLAVPLLLGLGLDEFSMSAASLPAVKRVIRAVNFTECQELARQVLRLESYRQIETLLRSWLRERLPDQEPGW